MKCPYCNVEYHYREHEQIAVKYSNEEIKGAITGYGISTSYCPSCGKFIVLFVEGRYFSNEFEYGIAADFLNTELLLPKNSGGIILPDEVPSEYREDFEEASALINISPKASAALGRRVLQKFLHEHIGIKKKSLAKEIQEFIDNEQLPSYLLDAVDAIRNIGNFAAHPIKDTSTGEIVDVEYGEAEWILEVLEMLYDFYFVQPIKLQKRQEELNAKLKALGKPEMSKASGADVS